MMDACTMDDVPLAVVGLPERVPFGFHALWVPAAKIATGREAEKTEAREELKAQRERERTLQKAQSDEEKRNAEARKAEARAAAEEAQPLVRSSADDAAPDRNIAQDARKATREAERAKLKEQLSLIHI